MGRDLGGKNRGGLLDFVLKKRGACWVKVSGISSISVLGGVRGAAPGEDVPLRGLRQGVKGGRAF